MGYEPPRKIDNLKVYLNPRVSAEVLFEKEEPLWFARKRENIQWYNMPEIGISDRWFDFIAARIRGNCYCSKKNVVVTYSSLFAFSFHLENLLITSDDGKILTFTEDELSDWLEDYSPWELFHKNILNHGGTEVFL